MRSSSIYTTNKRDGGEKPTATVGSMNRQEFTVNVGSSASNSEELLTLVIEKNLLPSQVEFTASINGVIVNALVFERTARNTAGKLITAETNPDIYNK